MQNLFSSMNRMNADIGRQNRGRDQHKLIWDGAKKRPNRIYHEPLPGWSYIASNQICTMNVTRLEPKRVRPKFQPWDGAKTRPNPHRGTFAGLLHLYWGTKPMRIARPFGFYTFTEA
jgi:hypothetical protein